MMKSTGRMMIPALLGVFVVMGSLGCASSPARQQNLFQGNEYRKVMERQKAEKAAEDRAAQKIPELNAEGYEKLGDRYLQQGNFELAFIQYHKSLEMGPGQLRVRYKMGQLYLKKGMTEDGKKEFQEILKADPNHGPAYEGMGQAFLQAGQIQEAEKNFQKAIQLNPSLWPAHNFLGIIFDRRGQFEAAITQYQKAIALQPQVGFLFNNLGISLALKRENEKAAAAFAEAARLDPSNPRIYNNLGLVLGRMERYPEAFEAVRKGGDEAGAYYNLGCVYMARGKNREAVAAFEKAVEMKPGFYVRAHEKMKKAKEAAEKSPLPKADLAPLSPIPLQFF